MVGLPRESRISRALIEAIFDMEFSSFQMMDYQRRKRLIYMPLDILSRLVCALLLGLVWNYVYRQDVYEQHLGTAQMEGELAISLIRRGAWR